MVEDSWVIDSKLQPRQSPIMLHHSCLFLNGLLVGQAVLEARQGELAEERAMRRQAELAEKADARVAEVQKQADSEIDGLNRQQSLAEADLKLEQEEVKRWTDKVRRLNEQVPR